MSWGSPPLIYDDEDEAALKTRFVELCAKYPDQEVREIGRYIFRDLRDGLTGFRGEDAALKWSRELDVQERIRLFRQNGGHAPKVPDKDTLVAEIIERARSSADDKAAMVGYRIALEACGHIVKQTDNRNSNAPAVPSAIMFKPVDFNRDPESSDQ